MLEMNVPSDPASEEGREKYFRDALAKRPQVFIAS